jgi:hypothetical protein
VSLRDGMMRWWRGEEKAERKRQNLVTYTQQTPGYPNGSNHEVIKSIRSGKLLKG